MEDALVLRANKIESVERGLNPCFNGRCTRTKKPRLKRLNLQCLNPCFNGRCTRTSPMMYIRLLSVVLILVLMEDALVRSVAGYCQMRVGLS